MGKVRKLPLRTAEEGEALAGELAPIRQLKEQLARMADQQAMIRSCLGSRTTGETGCTEETLRRDFDHEVKVQVLLAIQPLLARIHTLEDRVRDLERKPPAEPA